MKQEKKNYVYTGPGRIGFCLHPGVYTGPFWNGSATDPKLEIYRSSFGSVPDRFQNGPV